MTHEVKRYPNRKLYAAGKYVTLRRVGEIVRSGDRVRVTESRSGKECTAYVLAQLVSQETVDGSRSYNAEILADAIRCATQVAAAPPAPPAVSTKRARKAA